jgi:beta-phosphoglucomutase-like phosphatase (HAD superfamily)
MDGTLVDSTAGVEGAWHEFSISYPDIDVHDILSCELQRPLHTSALQLSNA